MIRDPVLEKMPVITTYKQDLIINSFSTNVHWNEQLKHWLKTG